MNDDDSHVEDELNCLQDVHQMAHDFAISSECDVAKGFHRILVGIKLKEHGPDLVTRVARQSSKDGVQNDTRTVSHLC